MIGVFDSGVGGLSVLREIKKRAPHLDVVYFGDILNAPYGIKSDFELKDLAMKAIKILADEGVDAIVCACNSISVTSALRDISASKYSKINIVEMVRPTVDAIKATKGKIVLLATPATIKSGIYQEEFKKVNKEVEFIQIPDLASAVEKSFERKITKGIVKESVVAAAMYNPKVMSLSCTHYSIAKDIFKEVIEEQGYDMEIFDPSGSVADEVVKRFGDYGEDTMKFLISKESSIFRGLIEEYFGDKSYSIEVI